MIYLPRPEDTTPESNILTVDKLFHFASGEQNSVDRHNYYVPSPVGWIRRG